MRVAAAVIVVVVIEMIATCLRLVVVEMLSIGTVRKARRELMSISEPKFAFETIPDETPVEFFTATGEAVLVKPPDVGKQFAAAVQRALEADPATREDDAEQREREQHATQEAAWARVVVNLTAATSELQRVIEVLRMCEAGSLGVLHVPRPAGGGNGGGPGASSGIALACAQKREALRLAVDRLREGAARARASIAVREESLRDAAALSHRWRLSPVPSNRLIQQADCSPFPFARKSAASPAVQFIVPNSRGQATVTTQSPRLTLSLSSVAHLPQRDATPAPTAMSSPPPAENSVIVATGAAECHALLSSIQDSLFAAELFAAIRDEAARCRPPTQSPQATPHVVVKDDDKGILLCCGAPEKALRVKLVQSTHLPAEGGSLPADADSLSLLAVAQEMLIDEWRRDATRAVREGATAWEMAPPQQGVTTAKPFPKSAASSRQLMIIEVLAVIHAHMQSLLIVSDILDGVAREVPGTVVHWDRCRRSAAVVSTSFTINGPRKSLKGATEGPSPVVRFGSVLIGAPLLAQFIKTSLA